MMNEKVEKVEVLRPEVQGSEEFSIILTIGAISRTAPLALCCARVRSTILLWL